MPRGRTSESGLPNLLHCRKAGSFFVLNFCACWQDVLLRERITKHERRTHEQGHTMHSPTAFSFSYFDLSCFRDELRPAALGSLYPRELLWMGTPAATKVRMGPCGRR